MRKCHESSGLDVLKNRVSKRIEEDGETTNEQLCRAEPQKWGMVVNARFVNRPRGHKRQRAHIWRSDGTSAHDSS